MSDVEYENKNLMVFWPSVSSGVVSLTVSHVDSAGATMSTPGCCDHVIDYCDRDVVTSVTIRVKDPAGYTTEVFSSGQAGQWARQPTGAPTYSTASISVPTTSGDETAIAMLITLVSVTGARFRRSQVVIIRNEPA